MIDNRKKDLAPVITGDERTFARLASLERKLSQGEVALPDVQVYCELATASGRATDAVRLLKDLKDRYPKEITLHSLYISFCLRRGDDAAAMAAIETMAGTAKPSSEFLEAALKVRKRLGPRYIKKNTPDSLSLCMIARDESTLMAPCLNGIKHLVDEIVLVDTGSTDHTADIARLFGAHIHHFQWCNDFSAARNFALSKASGGWVLVLDADEAIAASDFDRIRGLIKQNQDDVTAFSIETRNYCHTANAVGVRANDGRYPSHEAGLGWYPSIKVRLFRREEAIRFHFPVHERVEPSLKAAGIAIVPCDVPVHHYGHLNESRNQEKARRYYELGIAKLDEMGDDPAAIRELAVQAGRLERWEESLMLWQRFLAVRPDFPEAFINMASANWQMGRYMESLEWSRKAVAADSAMKEAHLNEGLSHMLLGNFKQALTVLETVVRRHRDYISARFMLGVAHAASGNIDQGLAILSSLQNTAARDALPQALDDIRRRLMGAGFEQAADHVTGINGRLFHPVT